MDSSGKRENDQDCEAIKRSRTYVEGPDTRERLETPSKTGLVWSGDDESHRHPRRTHIERPERITEILRYLRVCGIIEQCIKIETSELDISSDREESAAIVAGRILEERLVTVHSPYYLARFTPQRMRCLEKRGGIEALMEEAGIFFA